jgi:hypothetical protein
MQRVFEIRLRRYIFSVLASLLQDFPLLFEEQQEDDFFLQHFLPFFPWSAKLTPAKSSAAVESKSSFFMLRFFE